MSVQEILPPLGKEKLKGTGKIVLYGRGRQRAVVIAVEFAIEAQPLIDADGGVIVGLHLQKSRARAA